MIHSSYKAISFTLKSVKLSNTGMWLIRKGLKFGFLLFILHQNCAVRSLLFASAPASCSLFAAKNMPTRPTGLKCGENHIVLVQRQFY